MEIALPGAPSFKKSANTTCCITLPLKFPYNFLFAIAISFAKC